jgi:predicted MPP superfamily phosphohydrolase
MSLFFATFFLIYGLAHSYVFLNVRRAFHPRAIPSLILALVMLIMMLLPVVVRFLERGGEEALARVAGYLGYMWMGGLFLFIAASLFIDLCRLSLYTAGLISAKDLSSIIRAYKCFFFIPLIWSLSAVVYGYYEAEQIKVERIVIKTDKIPEKVGTIKVVQVSDVHLGLIVQQRRLGKILAVVRNLNPDILVSTGDLVDGQLDHLGRLVDPLKELSPPLGKYAIMGNHEFYAGINTSVSFMEKSGFTVLRGKGVTVGGLINIAGVDDITNRAFGYGQIPEKVLLSSLQRDKFTLLLKHRPVADRDAIDLFDLQLSGHTHKGQIFPFRYVTKLFFPMYNGYFKLSETSRLYASRGSGTWGPPIRFLTPPEVTLIELVHEKKEQTKMTE